MATLGSCAFCSIAALLLAQAEEQHTQRGRIYLRERSSLYASPSSRKHRQLAGVEDDTHTEGNIFQKSGVGSNSRKPSHHFGSDPVIATKQNRECTLNGAGLFGSEDGDYYSVGYLYQTKVVPGTQASHVSIHVLPALDRAIAEGIIPSLFDDCSARRLRRLQASTGTIVGISSLKEDDVVTAGLQCLGQQTEDCYVFKGELTVIGTGFRNDEQVDEIVLGAIQNLIVGGSLTDANRLITEVEYLTPDFQTVSPVAIPLGAPTTSPTEQPTESPITLPPSPPLDQVDLNFPTTAPATRAPVAVGTDAPFFAGTDSPVAGAPADDNDTATPAPDDASPAGGGGGMASPSSSPIMNLPSMFPSGESLVPTTTMTPTAAPSPSNNENLGPLSTRDADGASGLPWWVWFLFGGALSTLVMLLMGRGNGNDGPTSGNNSGNHNHDNRNSSSGPVDGKDHGGGNEYVPPGMDVSSTSYITAPITAQPTPIDSAAPGKLATVKEDEQKVYFQEEDGPESGEEGGDEDQEEDEDEDEDDEEGEEEEEGDEEDDEEEDDEETNPEEDLTGDNGEEEDDEEISGDEDSNEDGGEEDGSETFDEETYYEEEDIGSGAPSSKEPPSK